MPTSFWMVTQRRISNLLLSTSLWTKARYTKHRIKNGLWEKVRYNNIKQIITIQHTQSIHHTNGMVGSWTDWDLSESGIEQAERIGQKLAKQLSGHKIVMYASDLLWAKHTAEIVAKHMGITPNIRTELRERNLGNALANLFSGFVRTLRFKRKPLMTGCFLMLRVDETNGIA